MGRLSMIAMASLRRLSMEKSKTVSVISYMTIKTRSAKKLNSNKQNENQNRPF
ncbi:MAG: hypothetical protein HFE47_06880 [Clostridia bacterium]|nr:hypothetical protein [Clostridia bacterium]